MADVLDDEQQAAPAQQQQEEPTQTLLDPTGTPRQIPRSHVDAALKAGATRAVRIADPTGTPRWIPESKMANALQAGGQMANGYGSAKPHDPTWGERLRDTVANSAVGHAVENALPKVADALDLHPSETVNSPTYQSDKEQLVAPQYLATPGTRTRGALTSAGALTSVPNLEMAAAGAMTGGVAPMLQRLVSAGFTAQMAKGLYDTHAAYRAAVDAGDERKAREIQGQMGADALMALAAGKHAISDAPAIAPRTPLADRPIRPVGAATVDAAASAVNGARATAADAFRAAQAKVQARRAAAQGAPAPSGPSLVERTLGGGKLDEVIPGDTVTPRQRYEAAKDQGVDLDLAQATGATVPSVVKRGTEHSIASGDKFARNNQANIDALHTHVGNVLNDIHPESIPREDVGTRVRATLDAHQQGMMQQAGDLYKQVDESMGDVKPDMRGVRGAAEDILLNNDSLYGNTPELLRGPASGAYALVKRLAEGGAQGENYTWSDLQKIRTDLLNQTRDPAIVGSRAEGWLKQMTGAIDDAMTDAPKSGMPTAVARKFRDANEIYSRMKQQYDTPQSKFYSMLRNPDGTQVANSAAGLTPHQFRLMQDAARDTGDTAIIPLLQRHTAERILNPAGNPTFDLKGMPTRFGRAQKESLSHVLSDDHLQRLENVARTSRILHADSNPSGTAKVGQAAAELAALTHPATALPAAAEMVAARVAASKMTDPKFVENVMRRPAGDQPQTPVSAANPEAQPTAPSPASPPAPEAPPTAADASTSATSNDVEKQEPETMHPAGRITGIDQETGLPIVDRSTQPEASRIAKGARVELPDGAQGTLEYHYAERNRARVKLDDGRVLRNEDASTLKVLPEEEQGAKQAGGGKPQAGRAGQGAQGQAAEVTGTNEGSAAAYGSRRATAAGVDGTGLVGPRVEGVDGNETPLLTAGGKLSSRYRVVEAGDLIPSHNAHSFAENPKYPEGIQERAYDSSKEAQNRVINQAQNYEPEYTVNGNTDAVNGPPVITPDGVVVGGNSRTMSTQRLYRDGTDAPYRETLESRAAQFGIDPETIKGMREPVLVREVDHPGTADGLRRLASDLNKPATGALEVSERAVSVGKSIKPETLQAVSHMLQSGDMSLRELMADHGGEIMNMLVRDGAITERERPQYMKGGNLSDEGKTLFERALMGSVLDDPRLMDAAPPDVTRKLEKSLGNIAAFSSRPDEWNVIPALREAVGELAAIRATGSSVSDRINQVSLLGDERNPVVDTLIRALSDKSPNEVRAAFTSYATDANHNPPGQVRMLGGGDAFEAFNQAFGGNLSEQEFLNGITEAAQGRGGTEPERTPDTSGDAGVRGGESSDAGSAAPSSKGSGEGARLAATPDESPRSTEGEAQGTPAESSAAAEPEQASPVSRQELEYAGQGTLLNRRKPTPGTFDDWIKDAVQYPTRNSRDLTPTAFKNDESPEPFMGKYSIVKGAGGKNGFYSVYDGDKVIASMTKGSLAVDKKYRRLGIGVELAKTFMRDYPDYRPDSVTSQSKNLFEKAWEQNQAEGRSTLLNREQVNTPEFKRWFGDSKVVDGQGDPQIVYHGTNDKFTKVNFRKGAQGLFWFTSDPDTISSGEAGAQGTKNIMPLYAKIENPAGWKEYGKFSTDELEGRGYDGVILPEKDGSFNGYIFKEAAQVKSADRNRGTFDPSNPSILKKRGPWRGSDSGFDVYPADGSNAPMLHAGDAASSMLGEVNKTLAGGDWSAAAMSRGDTDAAVAKLRALATDESGKVAPERSQMAAKLADALDSARDKEGGAIIVRPGSEDAAGEEQFHAFQHRSAAGLGDVMLQVGQSPVLRKAMDHMAKEYGYPRDPAIAALETTAKAANGDWKSAGLTLDEAVDFFDEFMRALVKVRGEKVLKDMPAVAEQIYQARGEYGTGNSDTGTGGGEGASGAGNAEADGSILRRADEDRQSVPRLRNPTAAQGANQSGIAGGRGELAAKLKDWAASRNTGASAQQSTLFRKRR